MQTMGGNPKSIVRKGRPGCRNIAYPRRDRADAGLATVSGPTGSTDELARVDMKRRGQLTENPYGRRIFGLLDVAHIAGAQTGAVGKLLLRQAPGVTRCP